MLVKYNFFDKQRLSWGSFENDFVDNNDGTVADKATGLMWQKNGSSSSLANMNDAKRYIKKLNKESFASHSDWRMPTIIELASLLEESRINGVHIDPVFGNKQTPCWTADESEATGSGMLAAWIVSFKQGQIFQAEYSNFPINYSLMYRKNYLNFVKAVRSVK